MYVMQAICLHIWICIMYSTFKQMGTEFFFTFNNVFPTLPPLNRCNLALKNLKIKFSVYFSANSCHSPFLELLS